MPPTKAWNLAFRGRAGRKWIAFSPLFSRTANGVNGQSFRGLYEEIVTGCS